MTFKEIAGLFESLELRLITSLKRNMQKHLDWEKQEGFNWPAWQTLKLRSIEQFRKENLKIMQDYAPVIDQETARLLQEQFLEGQETSEKELSAMRRENPLEVMAPSEKSFFGVDSPRLEKLMEEVGAGQKKAERAALRTMDDVYRETIAKAELAAATGSLTPQQAIDMATKEFLNKGINCIEYKNGHRVNIASYAEMALRTASTRSKLMGEAKRREAYGVDTVLVSQYGACSETCLPWQGRVYIDDVYGEFGGEVSGDRGHSRNGKWCTLLSAAVSKGLFHPNCRHTFTTWFEGISTLPKPMDTEKTKKNYELEQKQRGMEREVRRWKRLAEGTIDPIMAEQYRSKVKQSQKQLRDFVKQHGDVLRRDYWRENTHSVAKISPPDILSMEEKATLEWYVGGGENYKLNEKLRNGLPLIKEEIHTVQLLDSALEKLPRYQGVVTRDLHFLNVNQGKSFLTEYTKKDQSITVSQFMSSTAGEKYITKPHVRLVITSKNGRDIRSINPNEAEILFARNTILQTTDVQVGDGFVIIFMEEIT